jgi:hypothetical protein
MHQHNIEFYLPLGLVKDEKIYRRGRMRLATTLDELEIQEDENTGFNTRYRDILLLSKVIEELDGLSPITTDIIENLFEVDFLYLQILFKQIHGGMSSRIFVQCPSCKEQTIIHIPSLYKDMSLYKDKTKSL